ncbi:hypothetical protein V8G54_037359, partial [Vigna mungo]
MMGSCNTLSLETYEQNNTQEKEIQAIYKKQRSYSIPEVTITEAARKVEYVYHVISNITETNNISTQYPRQGEKSVCFVLPLENFLAEVSPNLVTQLMGLPDTQDNTMNKKMRK